MAPGAVALLALAGVAAGTGAVLWSTGYLPARRESLPAAGASVETKQEGAPSGSPSSHPLRVPANATVTLPRENVTLTILSGTVERVNAETRTLSLHIRFSNNGTRSFYRTYYSSLRLLVDGVLRSPTDPPMAQVDAVSAGEFDYRFDVPATATRAVLRVMHDDQSGEIALDLTPGGF